MKKILLPILIIVSLHCYSQDTIYWSPCYQLKFEDFKGTSDTTKIDLANSYIQVDYTYNVANNQLQFTVNCYFFKNLSWTKYRMAALMEHEQTHFNIAKLFALKLEQRFKAYKITNTVNADLKEIYKIIVAERLTMDNLFDEIEKENSKTDIPQKKFEADIRKQLPACKKNG